jgi:hypothetical protein
MLVSAIALTLGVSWASGIKLYAAVLTLGILGITGNVTLPENLQVLANPLVIGVAGFMYVTEFFADKIPGFDSGWDAMHTFIRIPAGAALAAASVWSMDPAIVIAAFLLGGAMSAGSHGVKMSARLMINASPEPFSNWAASVTEDIAVIVGLYAALHFPLLFLFMLAAFIAMSIWLLPKIFRAIVAACRRVAQIFAQPQ